jgi:hypothetical protein
VPGEPPGAPKGPLPDAGKPNDPRFDPAAQESGQLAEVPRDFRLAKPGDRDYVAGQPIDEAELQRTQEAARRRAEANRDLDERRADEARANYGNEDRNPNRQPGYASDPNRQPPDRGDPYHRPDYLTDPNRKPDDFNDPDRRPTGVTDPTVRPDDIGNDERQPPSRR